MIEVGSPITYTLDIPVRFRDRDVEVFVVPCVTSAPNRFAGPSFEIQSGLVVYISGKRGVYTNVSLPYVEVHVHCSKMWMESRKILWFSIWFDSDW